ncbi:MAG: hypothetical protein GY795_49750, partial [Desulfobacterales bacterium]|nr:hypothetical protein [Desulfobacterales bacterium]
MSESAGSHDECDDRDADIRSSSSRFIVIIMIISGSDNEKMKKSCTWR